MKGTKQKPAPSYSGSHAVKEKNKVSTNDNGGKMTKFRSLDEIPDASPDYDWGAADSPEDSNSAYGTPQDSQFNNYFIKSTKIGSPVDKSPVLTAPAKIPPLPYDQNRAAQSKAVYPSPAKPTAPPVQPNSKYFDYDNGNDNFDDDEMAPLPAPSPKKGLRLEANQKVAASMPAPPLPCNVNQSLGGGSPQGDSIYFSKKPRPVNFKPYTMKQYKMIQPKEYVEISNLKPDLNSEELVAKRANLDRRREFARNLQSYNQQVIAHQPKLPPAAEKHDILISEQKFSSNRQKALEFAKQVPKPKVAAPAQKAAAARAMAGGTFDPEEAAAHAAAAAGGMSMGAEYQTESRIMELEAQHNNRKLQIEAIRRTMGMK